jgi:hypothetical protein
MANYYTIVVGDRENVDAAWYCPNPKAAAAKIAWESCLLERYQGRNLTYLRQTPVTLHSIDIHTQSGVLARLARAEIIGEGWTHLFVRELPLNAMRFADIWKIVKGTMGVSLSRQTILWQQSRSHNLSCLLLSRRVRAP